MMLPTATMLGMFRDMLRIRRVEEMIAERYSEQQMRCPVHLCIGQEATPVGVCTNLTGQDWIFSTHRSHGHYLAKGGSLKKMMAEIYGKETGCSHGKGGSMHLIDRDAGFGGSTSIVSGTIPLAVGTALGWKMQGMKRISATFFGEAATEEGVFHESVNFAVLHRLPVLFVCENNLYSVYTPLAQRQPQRRVADFVRGYGLSSHQIDGNDVLAVHQAVQRAVEDIRNGDGPVFLECMTYRWREHCGPNYDNSLGYREESEFEFWRKECPVQRMQDDLTERRLLDPALIEQMEADIAAEISAAFNFASASDFPAGSELLNDIFSEVDGHE